MGSGESLLDSALQEMSRISRPCFELGSWLLDSIVIGSILGFKYSLGKTEKDKQYRLDSAIVTENPKIKNVNVLAMWYRVNKSGILYQVKGKPHFYIDSHNYIGDIKSNLVIKNVDKKCIEIDIKYLEEKLQKIKIVQI